MSDPRGNVLSLAAAGVDNAILAVREGWDVNTAYYESPADVDLATDVASFQEDTRAGRFPGVERLVIDGRLGPKTKRAIQQVSANAGNEAGAQGPDDWPEWFAKSLTFTNRPVVMPTPEPGIVPEVLIPDPAPTPAPVVEQGGGGGGFLGKALALGLVVWAVAG